MNLEELEKVGLCIACAHSEKVVSAKGSMFFLCKRFKTEPAFPKYPKLPVRSCAGFEEHAQPSHS